MSDATQSTPHVVAHTLQRLGRELSELRQELRLGLSSAAAPSRPAEGAWAEVARELRRSIERFSEEVWALRSVGASAAAPASSPVQDGGAQAWALLRDELGRLHEDVSELRSALFAVGGSSPARPAERTERDPEWGPPGWSVAPGAAASEGAAAVGPADAGQDAEQLAALRRHYSQLRQVLQAQVAAALSRGATDEQRHLDAALAQVKRTEEHLASLGGWQAMLHNEVQALRSAMLMESVQGVHTRVLQGRSPASRSGEAAASGSVSAERRGVEAARGAPADAARQQPVQDAPAGESQRARARTQERSVQAVPTAVRHRAGQGVVGRRPDPYPPGVTPIPVGE